MKITKQLFTCDNCGARIEHAGDFPEKWIVIYGYENEKEEIDQDIDAAVHVCGDCVKKVPLLKVMVGNLNHKKDLS